MTEGRVTRSSIPTRRRTRNEGTDVPGELRRLTDAGGRKQLAATVVRNEGSEALEM
jgi:hypothetical protein